MSYLLKPAHQPGVGTELVQHIDWTPNGMGCACESKGMGIFSSMDFTEWGWAEWGSVIAGAFVLMSTVSTAHRGARAIASIPGKRRRKKATQRRLEEMTRR